LTVTRLEPRETPAVGFAASGAAVGGLPLVQVDRPDGTPVARFAAFDPAFRGGVRAAVAEVDGNLSTVEVIAGAGPGGGPHVRVFRVDLTAGNAVTRIADFFPFDPAFRGGVRVAAGNLGGPDTRDEMVVAADAGGGPHVQVFGLAARGGVAPIAGPLGSFFAFEPGFTGGVRVAAGELNGNLLDGDELVVSAGRTGGPRVRVFRTDGAVLADSFAFRPTFAGGVNVAVTEQIGFGQLSVDARSDDRSQRNAGLNSFAASRVGLPPGVGTTAPNLIGGGIGIGLVTPTPPADTATDADTLRRFGDPGPLVPLPPLVGPAYVGQFVGLATTVPIVVFV
jgi:hypothetical protein